jgi:hypothetical protein
MKNLIKITLGIVLAVLVVSCGKNYTYEKVVVNNSDETIIVKTKYEGYKEEIVIAPRESKVVFVCTYQSYKKPTCDDVENKFELIGGSQDANSRISNKGNWNSSENGKTVRCTYEYNGE